MKKRNLFAAGIITTLLLTGCGNSSNAETENLKKQIATLEQQISDMEQAAPVTEEKAAENTAAENTSIIETPEAVSETTAPAETTRTADTGSTTSTIDELTALVDDFVTRAEAATPGSDEAANMETFFALKKEGNKLENDLDLHENELEKLYRNGSLTRDDYRLQERDVEHLEDKLDNAEDRLEYTFGIDD